MLSLNAAALNLIFGGQLTCQHERRLFNIREKFILTPAKDECLKHFGKWQLTRLGMFPSTLTQLRRIDKIAEDVERQMFERLSESLWHAIQVDESADAAN